MFILYFFRVQHENIKILTKWRLNIYTIVHFFHFVFFQSIGNQLSQISILTITVREAVSRHCPKGSLSSNVFSFPFSYSIFSWQVSNKKLSLQWDPGLPVLVHTQRDRWYDHILNTCPCTIALTQFSRHKCITEIY